MSHLHQRITIENVERTEPARPPFRSKIDPTFWYVTRCTPYGGLVLNARWTGWSGIAATAAALLALALVGCGIHERQRDVTFTIEGAHQELSCSACHGGDWDQPPSSTCKGCHQQDRPTAHWDDDCGECHGQWTWDDLEYPHEEWPLTGAHRDTPCEECHPTSFEAEDTCLACHDEDRPEGHITAECDECHDTVAWAPPTWGHDDFALVGGHDGLGCTQCHVDGFDELSGACNTCHQGDAPNNHPMWDCSECHSIWDWEDVDFDHSFFPLQGGHNNVPCGGCHAGGYSNTPDRCHQCHADDAPNGHYQTNCEQCHDIWGWDD